jgi:hypothetical protein
MVRPSVAKNRATSEHGFSEKLENFHQRENNNILNTRTQSDSSIKLLKTIGSKIKCRGGWISMVHCGLSKNRDGFKSREFDHNTSQCTCSRNFRDGNFLFGRLDGGIENFNSR